MNEINDITFKSNNFKVIYFELERIIKNINQKGLLTNKVRIGLENSTDNEANLRFEKFIGNLEIDFFKTKSYYELDLKSAIYFMIFRELSYFGIGAKRINSIYKNFLEFNKDYPFILDVYVLLIRQGAEVYFSISNDKVSILTKDELEKIESKGVKYESLLKISVNKCVSEITKKDEYLNIDNSEKLPEGLSIILKKMQDPNFNNFSFNKGKSGLLDMLVSEKTYNAKDVLHGDLVRRYQFGEIITKVRDNEAHSYIVKEFIRLF